MQSAISALESEWGTCRSGLNAFCKETLHTFPFHFILSLLILSLYSSIKMVWATGTFLRIHIYCSVLPITIMIKYPWWHLHWSSKQPLYLVMTCFGFNLVIHLILLINDDIIIINRISTQVGLPSVSQYSRPVGIDQSKIFQNVTP